MYAKQLMKGDYVSFVDKETKEVRVARVEDYFEREYCTELCTVSWTAKGTILKTCIRIEIEQLKPIVLVRDILVKNGFKKVGDYFVITECPLADNEGVGRLIWTNGHIETLVHFNRCEVVVCECKYVHQLQHALRLFGVRKEVVL